MDNNYFSSDYADRLSELATELLGETTSFVQGLPIAQDTGRLFEALREASSPSLRMLHFERVYELAVAIAELSIRADIKGHPDQELTDLARSYAISFNGFGNVSRPVPDFALT